MTDRYNVEDAFLDTNIIHRELPNGEGQYALDRITDYLIKTNARVTELESIERVAEEFALKDFDDGDNQLAIYFWRAVVPLWQDQFIKSMSGEAVTMTDPMTENSFDAGNEDICLDCKSRRMEVDECGVSWTCDEDSIRLAECLAEWSEA